MLAAGMVTNIGLGTPGRRCVPQPCRKPLNDLGVVSGIAGLITIIPPLEAVGAVFGLGLIVWFAWLGTILLRSSGGRVASL